jgi:formamidopyrimidine-DNA glycosylase
MDGSVVVGVGNIYASESLFRARIHPEMPARDVSMASYATLASAIQDTLTLAIKAGGTTLRDFRKSDGKAGYFAIELNVYGREGLPCKKCGGLIKSLRQSGRSTFFCPLCQNDKNKKKPAEIRPVKKPEKK